MSTPSNTTATTKTNTTSGKEERTHAAPPELVPTLLLHREFKTRPGLCLEGLASALPRTYGSDLSPLRTSTTEPESRELPLLYSPRSGSSVPFAPTPCRPLEAQSTIGDKFAIIMVGLPCCGKTSICRRLSRYLAFFHGACTEVFSVADCRREFCSSVAADFFDPSNNEALGLRDMFFHRCIDKMTSFLSSGPEDENIGKVALFDGTNFNKQRRECVRTSLEQIGLKTPQILFVECITIDEELILQNIAAANDPEAGLPDSGLEPEEAIRVYKERRSLYSKVYEPLDDSDDHLSWVKLINGGKKVQMNSIEGFIPGRIVAFLIGLNANPQQIYLCRHGLSQYNSLGRLGGDSSLSREGENFALKLAEFVEQRINAPKPDGSLMKVRLWTSSLRRTIETARHIKHPHDGDWVQMRPRVWRALDELHAGQFDGWTYEEIERLHPEEARRRSADKLHYQYPRGESYLDVIRRLDPIVHELEKTQHPIMIIAHQGVLRLLYAYFRGLPRDVAPRLDIPVHTVLRLTPRAYSCGEEAWPISPPDLAPDSC